MEKGRTVKLKLSDKVKNVISTVAPTLGAALGGPLGAMAGNVISAALGDGDVEKILVEQKPETLLALRKAEHEFLIQLENLIFLAVASGTLEPAPGQQRTIDMLLGMLATGIPMVMAFWFGSTSGSAVKSAMLANSKPADA